MTVYSLIDKYNENNRGGHFFDHSTLKFFGERISDMRVLKGTVTIKDASEKQHECYMLSSLQRKHPLGPRRVYHYFDCKTFDHVIK